MGSISGSFGTLKYHQMCQRDEWKGYIVGEGTLFNWTKLCVNHLMGFETFERDINFMEASFVGYTFFYGPVTN